MLLKEFNLGNNAAKAGVDLLFTWYALHFNLISLPVENSDFASMNTRNQSFCLHLQKSVIQLMARKACLTDAPALCINDL
jgi:hypothetical protein